MEKFNFYNPTRLINGKDAQKDIGNVLASDGIKSVLLVYGKNSIKKSGLLDEILTLLKDKNIGVVQHPGVKSNPVLTHAREGVKQAKENKVDAILAVGGGSVIDESKAIAAGATVDFDVWKFYTGEVVTSALPLYSILTISATGSEMNGGSVLTNEETNEKFTFGSPLTYPKVSIVNPEFTYSLPKEYLLYSAADIITHTVEVYFTAKTLPLIQKRFMENIVKTVIETTEILLENPEDYNARAEFSLAATWALNNLTFMGSGKYMFPNHMIEHSLSALYDVPHGAGLAVVLIAWMKWTKEENAEIYARFAKELFGLSTAEEGIKGLEDWYKKIGLPITLEDLNIKKGDLQKISENAFLTSQKWGMKDIYTVEAIKEVLDLA